MLKLKVAGRVAGGVFAAGIAAQNVLRISNGKGQGTAALRAYKQLGMRYAAAIGTGG